MSGRPTAMPGASAGDVFGLVRGGQVATRADIRERTGLSRTAVTLRVDQLLKRGLVTERAEGASTGGRPPTRLAFDPASGIVLAASIGAARAQVAVCDLGAQVLDEREFVVSESMDSHTVLTTAAEHLAALRTDMPKKPLYGIGIGVPSAVDVSTGRSLRLAAGSEPSDVAVSEFFTDRFEVPARVDSDVNVLALAEHARRPGTEDLLVLKASTGIGAGIIAGGRLQRGARGLAGEIGHIKVAAGAGKPCRCGDQGCLETVAAGWALLDHLREQGRTVSGLSDLVELVRTGDPDALRLIRDAGRHIGEAVAAAVNLLNPAVIVIRGDLSRLFDPLAAGLRERVYQLSSALASGSVRIEPGADDAPTGVQACAAMILDDILAPEAINILLDGTARD